LLQPPDLPDALQHPYFNRVDFMLAQSTAQRYIADENLLGSSPFYRGPALPDIDPLMRKVQQLLSDRLPCIRIVLRVCVIPALETLLNTA
jgi:hypothetical protein